MGEQIDKAGEPVKINKFIDECKLTFFSVIWPNPEAIVEFMNYYRKYQNDIINKKR